MAEESFGKEQRKQALRFTIIRPEQAAKCVPSSQLQDDCSSEGTSVQPSASTLVMEFSGSDNVGTIREQLRQELCIKSTGPVKIIFAGKILSDDEATLDTMNIGPTTALHAVVMEHMEPTDWIAAPEVLSNTNRQEEQVRSFFYVFCKTCWKLQRGKLRVRCGTCKSLAVVLLEEPTCWNDVLSASHLRCQCLDSGCISPVAEFFFKCTSCSELSPSVKDSAVPLTQIKSNVELTRCVTCNEIQNPILQFFCDFVQHTVCVDCFVSYASVCLSERRFRLSERFGYTLPCPMPDCNGCISDPHHFRLLGTDMYKKFQKFATETFLLGQNGVFCPRPNCGEGFLMEDPSDVNLVICPNCGSTFCIHCSNTATDCQCLANGPVVGASADQTDASSTKESVETLSLKTIRKVCKQCPRCHVRTERSGGCHHMICCQCGFSWCWLCLGEWSDECQWDHWFD